MELERWTALALRTMRRELRGDSHWYRKLRDDESAPSVHLAVMAEPFLTYLLGGAKTVESRFSVNRCAPFGRATAGDIVLLKAVSAPVVGVCEISRAWYFDLSATPISGIKERFGRELCADNEFWTTRRHAGYASLFEVKAVRSLSPFPCPKRDRRGWVVLGGRSEQLGLSLACRS